MLLCLKLEAVRAFRSGVDFSFASSDIKCLFCSIQVVLIKTR